MSTAVASEKSQGNGKPVIVLDPLTTTLRQAMAYVASGQVTMEAYQEWDDCRIKAAEARAAKRTVAAMSAEEFLAAAGALTLDVGGSKVVAKPKQFSTGSYGWNYCGKLDAPVDGGSIKVQASVNLIVVGSKPN